MHCLFERQARESWYAWQRSHWIGVDFGRVGLDSPEEPKSWIAFFSGFGNAITTVMESSSRGWAENLIPSGFIPDTLSASTLISSRLVGAHVLLGVQRFLGMRETTIG
jgi:hypothetical protein